MSAGSLDKPSSEQPSSEEPSSTIELVVFDMDGVLYHLDRARRLDLLAELSGLEPQRVDELTYGSDFETAAEAGAYPTGSDYLAEFNRRLGTELTRLEWIGIRRQVMTPVPEVLNLAERLASSHIVALLTNNVSLVQESLADLAPEVARIFGGNAHTSSRFGARKPDPEVFERLLAHHETEPSAAVFIDDNPQAVNGAEHAGVHGITFTTIAELRDGLRRLGVDVSGSST